MGSKCIPVTFAFTKNLDISQHLVLCITTFHCDKPLDKASQFTLPIYTPNLHGLTFGSLTHWAST